VTNAQYALCVSAGVCQPAGRKITDANIAFDSDFFRDNNPVVGVSYYDTSRFCTWLGARLPTEEEWEKAARGEDGRRYPWGDPLDPSRANLNSSGPYAVGSNSSGTSPYGVYDLAGNAFEWTSSQSNGRYIVRGGSWFSYPFRARTADRGTKLDPNFANYDIGFRCAK
jgi:formylglycine-generating enzyme required for sulfatase activity